MNDSFTSASLPIDAILPDVRNALRQSRRVVLQAEPGAGKTTGVPPALLTEDWLAGRRILMLEPRRLAARMAASFMAERHFAEPVGETVGYTVRMESRVGRKTRIEVVTEGILTRRLQHDPGLADVGLVIFDEFHERNLQTDLGLALALDVQEGLREDLRVLIMSATLDGRRLSEFLGDVPFLQCAGRAFPVATRHLPPRRNETILDATVRATRQAMRESDAGILVFLPGMGEIARALNAVADANPPAEFTLHALHGTLSWERQKRAVAPPAPGERKIVFATAIAETSLTIEGISAVVDSGLMRTAQFDVGTDLGRLTTGRVSRDAADQRRGRAGRLGPGTCWRVWGAAEDAMLPPHRPAEILTCDLAHVALELAVWGVRNPQTLKWLDLPSQAAWRHAYDTLAELAAARPDGTATDHGRAIAALGVAPRLGHMMLAAKDAGVPRLGAALAALLDERDILPGEVGRRHEQSCDIRLRLDLVRRAERDGAGTRTGGMHRVLQAMRHYERRLASQASGGSRARPSPRPTAAAAEADWGAEHTGELIALAFPERVARRREETRGVYLTSGGQGATLAPHDALAKHEFLALAATDGKPEGARIFLAAPIAQADLERLFADRIVESDVVEWVPRRESVLCRRVVAFNALTLREAPLPSPDPEAVAQALMTGVRSRGLAVLPWSRDSEALRFRIAFMRRIDGAAAGWPDLSEETLLATLETWLKPFCLGVKRLDALRKLDLSTILGSLLPPRFAGRLEREAPTHLTVPSGSRIRLDYHGEIPVLAVKLQELFGLRDTPTVAGGRVKVLVHLLSPGGKPVQVTQDLASFWRDAYFHVRKELRARYPKHPWPEDPASAPPTRNAKRR